MKPDSLQDREALTNREEKADFFFEYEYCRALAEVLHYSPPPVTVGLYAQWGHGKKKLLEIIKDHLHFKAQKKGINKQRANCLQRLWTWLCLIGHIMFSQTVQKKNQCRHTQYIFIDFSTWEYIGCDHTWAGMITTLCDTIESKYKLPLSIFRVCREKAKNETNQWLWTKWYKVVVFCVYLLPLLVIGLVLCIMYVRPYGVYAMIAGIITESSMFILPVLYNCFFTVKRGLEKKMNRTNMSDQLGFMHCVKTEVEVLTNFLQFKSFCQQRDIRVVLLINDLDICTPDKVVGVLDAVNILLSDKEAPFISILAVDPQIMVECIEKSSNMFNNGYEYLNRIISLPFSVPQMNARTKLHILREHRQEKGDSNPCPAYGYATDTEYQEDESSCKFKQTKNEVVHDLESICHEKRLPGNKIQLERILNTITIELLVWERTDRKKQHDAVRDWVILANSWPCRLSWVLQCAEDELQSIKLKLEKSKMEKTNSIEEAEEKSNYLEQSLLQVFNDNKKELDTIKTYIKSLLELDSDPDVFEALLLNHKFKVKDIEVHKNIISLDHSLKRKLELIRGLRKNATPDLKISIEKEDV